MSVASKQQARLRRRRRVRAKVSGNSSCPRVSMFRSNRGVVAQLIDDTAASTLAAVSWFEPELRKLGTLERTKRAGALLADRAKQKGVSRVVFDRGGYRYHGHVRAFAEAMREAGIQI